MLSKFSDLRNKEMICVKDGLKIGYVDDVEFDPETYSLQSLIAFGKYRLFGLLGKYDDIKISCEQIQVIGEDIILVNEYERDGKIKSKKDSFFSKWLDS